MQPTPSLNQRQQRFTELVACGESLGQAYEKAGYACRGQAANNAASRLMKHPGVQRYLDELREERQAAVRLTREDLLRFYEDVILTPPARVTADSRLAQTYKATETEKSASQEIRMVDKIRAADGLRKLRGWDEPTEHHHTTSEAEEVVRKIMFGE